MLILDPLILEHFLDPNYYASQMIMLEFISFAQIPLRGQTSIYGYAKMPLGFGNFLSFSRQPQKV